MYVSFRCIFFSAKRFPFTGTYMSIYFSLAGIDKQFQHPKEGGAPGSKSWWRDLLLSLHSSWFWHHQPKSHHQSSVPHWSEPHICTCTNYHKRNNNFPVYRLGRWGERHQKSGLAQQNALRIHVHLSCARFCLQVKSCFCWHTELCRSRQREEWENVMMVNSEVCCSFSDACSGCMAF